ncbi:MAG: hypothetical protein ABSG02_14510 [Terriglobales bacterium]
MAWTYEQSTGKLRAPSGIVIGVGYAGRDVEPSGIFVGGKNNPAKEGIENIGPLPCGAYSVDWMELVHPRLGKFAIHLKPDVATEARILSYGRQPLSFFMHGDSPEHPGASSDGCIVQTLSVRQQLWNSGDRNLQVVPELPAANR